MGWGCIQVAIALKDEEKQQHFQWEDREGRASEECKTPINKANEMAVQCGDRWNGWLGLTHCLIYLQWPCEHSRGIHYLTSSITSHGQGKRSAFHTDTHPRDLLRKAHLVGGWDVAVMQSHKCLSWGMGYFSELCGWQWWCSIYSTEYYSAHCSNS